MRPEIRALLSDHDGVVTRAQLMAAVPHHVVDRAVSGGHLVRLLPQVFSAAPLIERPTTRLLAALRYAGPDAALSHTTGLSMWGLPLPPGQPLHVITDGRQLRADPEVVRTAAAGFGPSRRWSWSAKASPSSDWRTASSTAGRG